MSNEIRKRAGGVGGAGLPRPGSSPTQCPGYQTTVAAYSAGSPTQHQTARPPPPPFGGGGGGYNNGHHSQAAAAAAAAVSISPTGYGSSQYRGASVAQSRPAYNYTAPSPSYAGVGYNANGGTASSSASGSYGGYSTGGSNGLTSGNGAGNYAFANPSNIHSIDDNKYRKKGKGRRVGSDDSTPLFMLFGLVFLAMYGLILSILFFTSRAKTNTMLKQIDKTSIASVVEHVQILENRLQSTQRQLNRQKTETSRNDAQKIATLQKENRLLQQQADDLKSKYESEQATKQSERVKNRELAFSEQVQWLQAATRRESKRAVLERFGPGPHKVEITYALGYPEKGKPDVRTRYSFNVELAPVDLVPHAVHLFLEQVDHGLLNGTYFYLNGPHIIQAGPQLEDDGEIEYDNKKAFDRLGSITNREGDPLNVAAAKSLHKFSARLSMEEEGEMDSAALLAQEDRRMKDFAKLGLERLAFPDYSPEYPHVTWTLGYTGRPGGPDWYINKVDNTKGHGPGGQYQHALEEQGDSCFGRVEPGPGRVSLVENLFNAHVYNDRTEWHYFFEEPVEIVNAIVLTKKPEVVKINMGTPLHRQDFIHVDIPPLPRSAATFDSVLNDESKVSEMDPTKSHPANNNNFAATAGASKHETDPAGGVATATTAEVGSEGLVQDDPSLSKNNYSEQNREKVPPDGVDAAATGNNINVPPQRRKPIRPVIEGQAEA